MKKSEDPPFSYPVKVGHISANPVTVKDTTPPAKANRGDGFDYRWAAIFVAGSLVGALVAAFVARGRRRPSKAGNAGV